MGLVTPTRGYPAAGATSARRHGFRRPPRMPAAALLLAILPGSACVSHPTAVGPTTVAGPLPPASSGRVATAQPDLRAADGPLYLRDPGFVWEHASDTAASYSWSCSLENPSHRDFRVTVVVALLDERGREVHADDQLLQVEGGDEVTVRGQGTLEPDVAARVARWRLEYWAQLPEPPLRIRDDP